MEGHPMSVRQGLLALLARQPMYGYQLKTAFESETGNVWPLNIGQVYTTLSRLERDGLVAAAGDDDEGHTLYDLTPAGRIELDHWFASPVDRSAPARDELAVKLALAVTSPSVDVRRVVQTQRTSTMRTLQDYSRLKVRADTEHDLAWLLVLDSLIFHAEAEIRWLDHCESRLARHRPASGAGVELPTREVKGVRR